MSRRRPTELELRLRRRVADASSRVATRAHDYLEYVGMSHLPARRDQPRWGHGRPPHPRLERVFARAEGRYSGTVETLLGYREGLSRLPPDMWDNPWVPALDAAALYGLVRHLRPERYVEVGSGVSTLFVERARRDGGTGTTITSIDPAPRADVEEVCDRRVRVPLEATDLSVFSDLAAGDVVFVDDSHHALLNSDVTTFFFDVLPELPAGVVVGIHDVLLPDDYYAHWGDYYFSEQYVLGAMLLGGDGWYEPLLAAWWSSRCGGPAGAMEPVWDDLALPQRLRHGTSFWFRTTGSFTGGR